MLIQHRSSCYEISGANLLPLPCLHIITSLFYVVDKATITNHTLSLIIHEQLSWPSQQITLITLYTLVSTLASVREVSIQQQRR